VTTASDVLAELHRLEQLQHDLLFLARADDGVREARRTSLDLDDVVLEEASRYRPPPWVRVDLSAVSGANVWGHRGELARVVRNLLDNAGRFAHSEVRVSLAEVGAEARLVVEDDGPGIPEEVRAEVFNRFAKLDESRQRSGGAGLGLAIVAEIVRAHGGSVSLAGATPGTRVTVTLPSSEHPKLIPAALPDGAAEAQRRQQHGAQSNL
jgi:signal transduction histidine kinase